MEELACLIQTLLLELYEPCLLLNLLEHLIWQCFKNQTVYLLQLTIKVNIWRTVTINIAWNSRATHMHHTSDTLYFKEYNLVIKHELPLKLKLTGFVDACPPKITMPCIYFNKSRVLDLTLNMYISTLAMFWFQQTMGTKHSTFITTPSKNCYIFNKKNVWVKNIF